MTFEIPFGVSSIGEKISLPFTVPGRNHFLVIGCTGCGKTTLLGRIASAAARDPSRAVEVWTNLGNVPDGRAARKFPAEGPGGRRRASPAIGLLYEEAYRRLRALSQAGVAHHAKDNFLPLLIAVIDDLEFGPSDELSGERKTAAEQMEFILRTAHVAGISVVCSSWAPLCLTGPCLERVDSFFDRRIVMKAPYGMACAALWKNPSRVSGKDREAIARLSRGESGDFLFAYRLGEPVAGRVTVP